MKVSRRIEKLRPAPFFKLIPVVEKIEKSGVKVIRMNIGQPDIKTPKVFYEAVRNFKEETLKYVHSRGMDVLLEAVINYYNKIGIEFNSEDIIITQGASEAINFALASICDVGDEIIVPEPFYANYENYTDILSINISPIVTEPEDNFAMPSMDEFESRINNKTRAIMISNPSNPTGRVYTKSELQTIVDIALKHDLFIISDEVYKEFVYPGYEFISMASFKEVRDRVVILDSISKRYSCCGARIGAIATKNNELINLMMKLAEARLSVATIEQVGAAALQNVEESFIKETLEKYRRRRDLIVEGLSKIDGIIYNIPEGAFYTIVKLPVDKAEDFVSWMLQNIEIDGSSLFVAPACGFYSVDESGIDEVRISYCVDDEEVILGMKILKKALEKYPYKK